MVSLRFLFGARFKILVGFVILVGFGIRLGFLLGGVYHVDEFITMLAAVMVAEKGLPILPSGLFYYNGFLLSEMAGLLVAMLGFSEEISRWPALLVSTLTLAAYYTAGRRLFDSRLAGLIAVTLVAFDGLAIVWGGRARMYALAHFFVLLSLLFLLENTLKRPNVKGRYLCLLLAAAALLSHMVTFLIIAPLLFSLLLFTIAFHRSWYRYSGLWREILAGVVILGGALGSFVVTQSQTSIKTASPSPISNVESGAFGLGYLNTFFDPGLEISRIDDLIYFFIENPDYLWLLPFVGLAIGVSLYRLVRGEHRFADIAVLFLTLFSALVILEQGFLFGSVWQKSRYLFLTASPAFFLVSAIGLTYPLRWLESSILKTVSSPTGSRWVKGVTPVIGLFVLILIISPDEWKTAYAEGTGDYNSAFAFVREQMGPEDKIMSPHPSAAYLFAGKSDYYASQTRSRILKTEDAEEEIDRYVGGELIESAAQFNGVLAQHGPVWFVVDEGRLYGRFDPFFRQQFFAQMDFVHQSGQIVVFRSNDYPVPVPAEPTARLDHNFSGLISLEGYSLEPTRPGPDGTLSVGLFWRPLVETPPVTVMPKVFVQLRDGQNQVVAQADHYFYEGLLSLEEWKVLYDENEWLRDTADVSLPLPLDGGPYNFYVGLYNPETLERVPLTHDSSGENAAIIPLPAGR